jgi:hypothetical protein
MKLLTYGDTNTKLAKTKGRLVANLTLRSGKRVCPWATPACLEACVLEKVGHAVRQSVKDARDKRTDWFFDDREGFLAQLQSDLNTAKRRAAKLGLGLVVRLNTASDIPWEKVAPQLFRDNPDVTFYDYTKGIDRIGQTPANYHLTYSWSENSVDEAAKVRQILGMGYNVAAILNVRYVPSAGSIGPMPKTVTLPTIGSYTCTDGDVEDTRIPEVDGRGVVVGLRFKGSFAARDDGIANGFVIDPNNGAATTMTPVTLTVSAV